MKWLIGYVDYEHVEDVMRKHFGTSQYTDKAMASAVKRKLAIYDTVMGDTVYQAKRNLIHKIGTERIEFLSVLPA